MPEPHNRTRNYDLAKAIGACRELVAPVLLKGARFRLHMHAAFLAFIVERFGARCLGEMITGIPTRLP